MWNACKTSKPVCEIISNITLNVVLNRKMIFLLQQVNIVGMRTRGLFLLIFVLIGVYCLHYVFPLGRKRVPPVCLWQQQARSGWAWLKTKWCGWHCHAWKLKKFILMMRVIICWYCFQEAYFEVKQEVDADQLKDLKRKLNKHRKKRVSYSCCIYIYRLEDQIYTKYLLKSSLFEFFLPMLYL